MEKFPKKMEGVEITEDAEHIIIHAEGKDRHIPKQKKIQVNGEWVDTQRLVAAMAMFIDDDPTEALRKYSEQEKDQMKY